MTRTELEKIVRAALCGVAPELEGEHLDAKKPLRDQTDLDSMDTLNVMIALHAATGVDIPEADYPKLQSINDLVGYLARKTKR